MRQLTFSLFFVLCFLTGVCQPYDTDVLKKFIASEEFCKYVLPCAKCNTIVLVDTAGYFNIDSFSVSGRTIIIKRTGYPMSQIPVNDGELLLRSCSSLLITNYVRVRRKSRIQYYHYPTNGVGWVSYKYKNKKIKKTGFSYGQF